MSLRRDALPVLLAIIVVFAFSGALFAYTFSRLPPVPPAVVTQNGTVLFTRQQVIMGKYYLQKYGLMDYGSIEGMGAYFGVDFTSYTLELYELYLAQRLNLTVSYKGGVPVLPPSEAAEVKRLILDPGGTMSWDRNYTVSDYMLGAFNYAVDLYSQYLGQNSSEFRLRPDFITNRTVVRDLVAYFTWSALISLNNYTQGFPYMPGLTSPSTNAWAATMIMIAAILAVGFPVGALIVRDLVSHWNDPLLKVDLPSPGPRRGPSYHSWYSSWWPPAFRASWARTSCTYMQPRPSTASTSSASSPSTSPGPSTYGWRYTG